MPAALAVLAALVHVGPPASLTPKPLAVGQWARYVEHDGADRHAGEMTMVVAATAGCGTIVEVELRGHQASEGWAFCIDRSHQITLATLEGDPVDVDGAHHDEIEALRSRIVPPELPASAPREDITLPMGTFEQTVRVDRGATTTWLRPDVPFGAVVRVTSGARRDELVGYGDAPPSPAAGSAPHKPFVYLEAGVQQGELTGVSAPQRSHLGGLRFTAGYRHGAADVLFSISAVDNGEAVYPMSSTSLRLFALGARWLPWRDAPARRIGPDRSGVFLQAVAGYSYLRPDRDTMQNGVGLALGAGMTMLRGIDWALVAQADYMFAAYFDGDTRHLFAVSAGLRFALP